MATIKQFEDLEVWQNARKLVHLIYQLTKQEKFSQDFALKDQIRRAVSSIMHNIAEGFGAGSDSEFIRFLGYARRSATETQSQLYIALDEAYISQSQFDQAFEQCTHVLKQTNSLIAYLDRSRKSNYKTVREVSEKYVVELV